MAENNHEDNHEDNQENTPEPEFSEDASLEGVDDPAEGFPENDGEGATTEIPEVVPEVAHVESGVAEGEGVTFTRDLDEDLRQDNQDLLEAVAEDGGTRVLVEDYYRFSRLQVDVDTPEEYDKVRDLYCDSDEKTKGMLDKYGENLILGLFYWGAEGGDLDSATLSLTPKKGMTMVDVVEKANQDGKAGSPSGQLNTDLDVKHILSTLDDEDVLAELSLYVGRLLAGLAIVAVTGAVVGSVAVAVAKATSQKSGKDHHKKSSKKSSPAAKTAKGVVAAKGTKAAATGAKKAAKVAVAAKGAKAVAQKAKKSQKKNSAEGSHR